MAHEERLPQIIDVSTLMELGTNFVQATNTGVFVPKGTPKEIIDILDEAFRIALENPELIKKLKI